MNHLGYFKASKIDESFLADYYGKLIGDPTSYDISAKEEIHIFSDLAKVDGIREYLKATMAKDMQRYFAAPDQKSRDVIQGAFARTSYLRGKLKEVNKPKEVSKLEVSKKRYR